MENPSTDKKPDILAEDYKGTGAVVSGLGYGVIESKVVAAAGAVGGAALGAISPDTVNRWSDYWKETAAHAIDKNPQGSGAWGFTKRAFGKTIKGVFSGADWIANHLPWKDSLAKSMGGAESTRSRAVITAAGITGLVAFIGSLFHAALVGAESASAGKEQFDRAKGEIKTLRDEKEALTTELDTTSKELAKTKAEVTKYAAMNDTSPKAIISNAEHADTIVSRDAVAQQL